MTRRSSVSREASGEGVSPSRSRRARMKLSIGLRGQAVFCTFGSGGRSGGMNDQCFCHFAPCAIQSAQSLDFFGRSV